jgi:hypothetical protein
MATIDLLKLLLDEGKASLREILDAVEVIEARDDIPDPKQFWKKYSLYFESINHDKANPPEKLGRSCPT